MDYTMYFTPDYEYVLRRNAIMRNFRRLDDRTQRVLEKRFGLNGHAPHSLKALGRTIHRSPERCRMIINDGIDRIRELCRIENEIHDRVKTLMLEKLEGEQDE